MPLRRAAALLSLAFALAACGDDRPRHFGPPPGGPPSDGRGGPPPGGGDGPPREGRLFISPMGEPFRVEHADEAWFAGADRNGDGRLTRAEFEADALRFFAVLDRKKDGEIDPDDITYYETELVPEIGVGGDGAGPSGGGGRHGGGGHHGRHGGGGGHGGGDGGGAGGGMGGDMGGGGPPDGGDGGGAPGGSSGAPVLERRGAARFGYLDYPEPVIVADTNFNRGVDRREWLAAADERFAMLDKNGDGAITRDELPNLGLHRRGGPPPGGGRHGPPPQQ